MTLCHESTCSDVNKANYIKSRPCDPKYRLFELPSMQSLRKVSYVFFVIIMLDFNYQLHRFVPFHELKSLNRLTVIYRRATMPGEKISIIYGMTKHQDQEPDSIRQSNIFMVRDQI